LRCRASIAVLAVAGACSSTRTQQSAGEVIDDSVLTSKVKVALIDDPITKAGQINVGTEKGRGTADRFRRLDGHEDQGWRNSALRRRRQRRAQRPRDQAEVTP